MVMALRRRLAAEVRSPAAPWILYAIGSAARLASAAVTGRFNYLGDASSALNTANSYGQILAVLNLLGAASSRRRSSAGVSGAIARRTYHFNCALPT